MEPPPGRGFGTIRQEISFGMTLRPAMASFITIAMPIRLESPARPLSCVKDNPDKSSFDPLDIHYDPKSSTSKPTWFTVDIQFIRKAAKVISLKKLRSLPSLKNMKVLQRGMRLSVQPVTHGEWAVIMKFNEWESFEE